CASYDACFDHCFICYFFKVSYGKLAGNLKLPANLRQLDLAANY
ncbi:MAG: hypothetical protein ACI8X3_003486, partial [Saprospiraceae bacterium]